MRQGAKGGDSVLEGSGHLARPARGTRRRRLRPAGLGALVLAVLSLSAGPVAMLDSPVAQAATNCTTYSSPSTGSHQVCGAILAKYQALGGPSSFLGYAVDFEGQLKLSLADLRYAWEGGL